MKQRSTGYPRLGLSSAVKIIEEVSKMGKSWKKEQFASFGAKSNSSSAKSGAFAARIASLRDYGLITTDKETIYSTELAQTIAKPITSEERAEAIRQAFLKVGTFGDLYRALDKDEALPRTKVAEYAVFNLGILRGAMDKFINVFVDSGKYAKLVRYDKDGDTVTLLKTEEQTEKIEEEMVTPETETTTSEQNVPATPTTIAARVLDGLVDTSNGVQNEQGVNHGGKGWSLAVAIKTGHRLPADLRTSIRDLLESADSVADKLYELEGKE